MDETIQIVTKFTADTSSLQQGANGAASSLNQVAAGQTAVGQTAQTATGGVKLLGAAMKALVALAVVRWLQGTVTAFEEGERASIKLADSVEANAETLGGSAQSWTTYSASISEYTRFSEEAVKTSIALQAQFKLTGDQVSQLTPLIADLAEKQGIDLQSATIKVTRALGGSARALQMMGIPLEGVRKGIDNTQTVLDGLTKSVGGFAKQVQDSAAVQLAQLGNEFTKFKQVVGEAVAPVLIAIVKYGLRPLVEVIQHIPQPLLLAGAAFATITAAVKALAPVLPVVGDAFKTVFGGIANLGRSAFVSFTGGAEDASGATEDLSGSMDAFVGTASNANTSIQSVIARQQQLMTVTMGGIGAQDAMSVAMSEVALASDSEAAAIIEAEVARRSAIISAGGFIAQEEATQLAVDSVTKSLVLQAEAQNAASGATKVGAFAQLAGVLGKVGVVAAVATIAVGAFSAAWGYFRDRAIEAAHAIDELRIAAVASGKDFQIAEYIAVKYGDELSSIAVNGQRVSEIIRSSTGPTSEAIQKQIDTIKASGEAWQVVTGVVHQAGQATMVMRGNVEEQLKVLREARDETKRTEDAAYDYAIAQKAAATQTKLAAAAAKGNIVSLKGLDGAYKDFVKTVGTIGTAFASLTGFDIQGAVDEVTTAVQNQESAVNALNLVWRTSGEEAKMGFNDVLALAQKGGAEWDDFKNQVKDSAPELAGAFEAAVKAGQEADTAIQEVRQSILDAADAWKTDFAESINTTESRLEEAMGNGVVTVKELQDAVHGGAADIREWGDAFESIRQKFGKMSKPFLEWAAKKGPDALSAMQGALKMTDKQAKEVFGTWADNSKAAEDLATTVMHTLVGAIKNLNVTLKALAEFLHITLPDATEHSITSTNNLANAIAKIKDKHVKIDADTSPAEAAIESLHATLLSRAAYWQIQIDAQVHAGGLIRHQGGTADRSQGPRKSGRLMPDEIPAILQRGEYVIQRKAVQAYGKDFFAALNRGQRVATYSPSRVGGGGGDMGYRPIKLDIDVRPVIDRAKFIKELSYSTRITGR